MRPRGLLLVVLVLVSASAPSLAQDTAELRAAVAPAQTAVDAAVRVVDLAWPEATRDGSPDAAAAVRDALVAYAERLDAEWALPSHSTYREEALRALPFVARVTEAAAPVPEAVGTLARALPSCTEDGALAADESTDVVIARASLNETARALRALGPVTPEGVDTTALVRASDDLAEWAKGFTKLDECAVAPDVFALRLRPTAAWPTVDVRVAGTVSNASSVRIMAPALEWNVSVPVTAGTFTVTRTVPANATLERTTVSAVTPDGREATGTLDVVKAPSVLRLTGPSTLRTSANATVEITLSSPFPIVTDAANVTLGDGTVVPLVDGRGVVTVRAPASPGAWIVDARYAGTDRVASSTDALVVRVLTTAADAETVDASGRAPVTRTVVDAPSTLERWTFPFAVVLVALALAGLWGALRRRKSDAGPRALATGPAPVSRVTGAPPPDDSTSGLLTVVSRLVRSLRERELVPASMTVREVSARLSDWGLPVADGVVPAFERARYRAPEDASPGLVARAREWAREAWARVGGGSAS